MAEQERVGGVDGDVEQVGGEERNREPEDLAGRHLDLADVETVEQPILPSVAEEHEAVEPDPDGPGGDVPSCEAHDVWLAEHDQEDDRRDGEPGASTFLRKKIARGFENTANIPMTARPAPGSGSGRS